MPLEIERALHEVAKQAAQSSEQKKGIGKAPYLAVVGGNAADLMTTLDTLRSGRGREVNWTGNRPALIAGVKAGTTVAELLMLKRLAENHPKAAKVLGYTIAGVNGALAIHNARVGR